jgi:hypothetical protein
MGHHMWRLLKNLRSHDKRNSPNEDYWNILSQDRMALNLPNVFNKVICAMIDALRKACPSLSSYTLEISWTQMTMFMSPILLIKKLKLLHKIKVLLCMRTQLLMTSNPSLYNCHVTLCSISKSLVQ